MKNKVTKILQLQAERSRQLLVLGVVLFVSSIMASGVIQVTRAGNTDNTNVNITVTAGALSITLADTQFDLPSVDPGTNNANAIAFDGLANAITLADTTGSGTGWTSSAYFSDNFTNGGAQIMPVGDKLNWYPGNATLANGTGDNSQLALGANNVFSGTGTDNSLTLVGNNAGGAGAGSFNLYNVQMELDVPITAVAESYTTDMVFTIVGR